MTTNFETFDEVLHYVGSFGRFQKQVALSTQLVIVAYCANSVFMAFAILEPELLCNTYSNVTERCEIIEKCDDYSEHSVFYSVAQEFHLYCDQRYIPTLILSVQVVGSFIGGQVGGFLSDKYGRKRVMLTSYTLIIAINLITTLSHSWQVFALTRVVFEFAKKVAGAAMFVWIVEMTDHPHTLFMNLMCMWPLWYVGSAAIGHWTRSWRSYLLVVNGLSVLPLLLYARFPDSPRWLLQKKRYGCAAQALQRIREWNGRCRDGEAHLRAEQMSGIALQQAQGESKAYTPAALFRHPQLLRYTCTLVLIMLTASVQSNSFLISIRHLAGDPFADIAAYGSIMTLMPVLIYCLDQRCSNFGRRHLLLFTLSWILLGNVTIMFCYLVQSARELMPLITLFAILTANMTTPLWLISDQFSVELFPTLLRNIALGFVSVGGDAGAVLAPQLQYLENYWPPLPYLISVVLLALSFHAGYWYLHETKGRDLPETMADVEQLDPYRPRQVTFSTPLDDL